MASSANGWTNTSSPRVNAFGKNYTSNPAGKMRWRPCSVGLWSRIHVEQGWENALEAVLGERMNGFEMSRID